MEIVFFKERMFKIVLSSLFLSGGCLFGYQLSTQSNYDFLKQKDPFSSTRLKLEKVKAKVELDTYLKIVKKNPEILNEWIKNRTEILKRMQRTAYKPFSNEEINNWLNKVVKNDAFQRAFYYLYIKREIFKAKNKTVKLPDFKNGFKWLAKAIIETNNPIASYIGTDLIYFGFPNTNNPVAVKYSRVFSEPLYLTDKSCLGYYVYGKSFLDNTAFQDYKKAHNILYKGYAKCKNFEKRKDFSRVIVIDMKNDSAKAKALMIIKGIK